MFRDLMHQSLKNSWQASVLVPKKSFVEGSFSVEIDIRLILIVGESGLFMV